MAASSTGDSTVLRRSFGPIGLSSTDCRDRHLITVFSLIPYCFASCAIEAGDRWSSARTACVVLALPWRSWPIVPLVGTMIIIHQHQLGLMKWTAPDHGYALLGIWNWAVATVLSA